MRSPDLDGERGRVSMILVIIDNSVIVTLFHRKKNTIILVFVRLDISLHSLQIENVCVFTK